MSPRRMVVDDYVPGLKTLEDGRYGRFVAPGTDPDLLYTAVLPHSARNEDFAAADFLNGFANLRRGVFGDALRCRLAYLHSPVPVLPNRFDSGFPGKPGCLPDNAGSICPIGGPIHARSPPFRPFMRVGSDKKCHWERIRVAHFGPFP